MSQAKPTQAGRRTVTQLASLMRRQILTQTWRPGDQLPVMRDLARDYGVSIGTVRRAILKLEAEGLLTRRWGSGCFVTLPTDAQAASQADATAVQIASATPRVAASKSIVIMVPYDGHFYDRFTLEVCELAQQRGLTPVKIATPRGYEPQDWAHVTPFFEQLKSNPPEAIIANTLPTHIGRAIEDAFATRSRLIGVVMSDGPTRPQLWHRIMPQTAMIGEMAAKRFYEAGHRRVGLITNTRRIMPAHLPRSSRKLSYGHTELILALGRGLRKRGGPGMLSVFYNKQFPIDGPQPFGQEEIQRMADYLRKPNCPTAIIGHDFRLVAAAQAWELAGLPMTELPLRVGIGNTPWAHQAGFDSYCYQPEVMAKKAMALLDRAPAPRARALKIRVAPKLVPHQQHAASGITAAMLP